MKVILLCIFVTLELNQGYLTNNFISNRYNYDLKSIRNSNKILNDDENIIVHVPLSISEIKKESISNILSNTIKLLTITSIISSTSISSISPVFAAVTDNNNNNVDSYGFRKLPSGVELNDVKIGDGAIAEEGKTVQFLWVLRRSNGYFVDASSNYQLADGTDVPFIYKIGNTKKVKVIEGLDEGIRGMKVGGVRQLKIPPSLAYREVGDDAPGPMPAGFGPRRQILTRIDNEKWYFQVKLLKVK